MIHKIKVLFRALVAVSAMSAISAAGAQAAAGLNWPSGTTELTAVQAAVSREQVFTAKFGPVKCQEVHGEAAVSGTTNPTVTSKGSKYNDTGKTTCRGATELTITQYPAAKSESAKPAIRI